MSASVALTTSARRLALSQLVAANTSQTRSIWRYARNNQTNGDKIWRVSRRIDKCHRHPLANTRSKAETRGWPSTTHRQSVGGWALWRSRSDFSDLSAGQEKTPYSAIGSSRHLKPGSVWPGCLPSFLKMDYSANRQSADLFSKAHLQDFNFAQSSQSGHFEGLQYDPISGRMVPKPPRPVTPHQNSEQTDKPAIDCPPGSEVEVKLASKTTSVEDGQFQSGPSGPARHFNSQSMDCSPASELEALFAANLTSFQKARAKARVPEVSSNKTDVPIACPPGNELEAFSIDESTSSTKPNAEAYKVQGSAKPRDADADAGADLGAHRNNEFSPGSELEAMFISRPATCADQSRTIDAFQRHQAARQTGIPIECPPGGEIEAGLASELPNGSTQYHPKREASSHSIYCSPGSESEAKVVSDMASQKNQQPKVNEVVDCAPGSELEAMFKTNPAAISNTRPGPAVVAEPVNTNKANITVDCRPGNELEAKTISDKATNGNPEDTDALRASEIRARHTPKPHPIQEFDFDGSEDRVGDFLSQNQEVATEKLESATYRILAYDSSESQVTTTEAQSFFGDNDNAQPHEILARLHNPAKFVPYFAQLQQEGFELATGGGDILVFKKVTYHAKQAIFQPTVQQDYQIYSPVFQYLRHNSYQTRNPASSFKVSRQ